MFFYTPYFNFSMGSFLTPYFSQPLLSSDLLENKNLIQKQKNVQKNYCNKQVEIIILKNQLQKRHLQSKSKLWTEEEDQLLFKMIDQKVSWKEITQKFQGKSLFVCQRRFNRLIQQYKKWPKQNQEKIKYLHQIEKLPWRQIQKFMPKYTKKQIKQRYKNFLEIEVKRALWTIQEDIKLWQLVSQFGHNWVKFTQSLPGRSQLQLKNRYNKFLKPIIQKIANRQRNSQEDKGIQPKQHQ